MKKKFVLIGGGIGSFCFYNCLRVHGVSAQDIAVITTNKKPYDQFKAYCDSIGLKSNHRLRSDSGSRPDNFWGFPGYGLSETINLLKAKKFVDATKLAVQLFTEPVISSYYSPTAGQVYKGINKEIRRSKWSKSTVRGNAISLKLLEGKGYEISYKNGKKQRLIAEHVHLSLGHGTPIKHKKSLSAYYLDSDIIKRIKKKGGKVIVIGRGTAAAKVVEKLLHLKTNKKIQIVSLHRNKLSKQVDFRNAEQKRFKSWRLQQFNWPRNSFGGEYTNVRDIDRHWKSLWSAPTTVPNKSWVSLLRENIKNGKYRITYENEKADFTIDCSGFDESVDKNKFYKRIINDYNLKINEEGGFSLGDNFEIEKLCTYKNRVFVSGIAARGNSYGPVDSFLGQQYVAMKAIDVIPEIKKLSVEKSFNEWLKWINNKPI
jgi:pSer/pThr/pTyr-binding forkhead associated (FHA) protein